MSTYLWINILAVFIPVILSFDRKVHFYTNLKYLIPAIILTGIAFIIWDIIFTEKGIWGFNPVHLSGIYVFNLPVEESLFFVTVPYASVFTYEVFNAYLKKDLFKKHQLYISIILIITFAGLAILFYRKTYTTITAIILAVFLVLHQFILKSKYLSRFYFSYMIILFPFLIVDGLLTGSVIKEEIVWYNPQEILGLRIFTIPVEDTVYGMILIMMNVSIYEFLKKLY